MEPPTIPSRTITHRYVDPLDAVWLRAAADLGWRVERSSEVFAATDGTGRLTLGTPETLDPDDCLAQMVFHELCHALVQGPELAGEPDWGLDNESARDVTREHACLRLQAHLAGRHGLRRVLAPTTDFRAFYDALPPDPLIGEGEEQRLAREALDRAEAPPFAAILRRALGATAAIVRATVEAGGAALPEGPPPLWATLEPLPGPEVRDGA